jgi:DNA polymerase-3 subunit chi
VAEIGFYHLTRTPLDQALPRLLARSLEAGERAVVRCPSTERVAALDTALWACAEPDWLPHGTVADGDASLQPIWLTTADEAPNGGRFLFLVEGAEAADLSGFARVFDLFDGRDETALAAARRRWQAARAGGHRLSYWQQTARGWEKKQG